MSDRSDLPTLSRRQTLQGIAWATPAIVLATSVPAAASSAVLAIPTGEGVTPDLGSASYASSRWNATTRASVSAIVLGMYVQNVGDGAQGTVADGLALTVVVPVSGTSDAWGLGQGEGIAAGEPWTLASYSRSGDSATLVVVYTGGNLGVWDGVSVSNLWFASDAPTSDIVVTATANATYTTGATSVRTDDATIAGVSGGGPGNGGGNGKGKGH